MRREAPCRIPGAAGRNSKGGSWVQWLTRIRKVNGTIACQKSDGQVQVLGLRRLRDPCDMAKAGLLKPQSPGDVNEASVGMAPDADATPGAGIVERSAQPSGCRAMPNEGIQGDEWGAYVTLGRTTRTNAGSPAGREPQGDGVPVVVVGVTTHQGGRESRPQGEGAQVIGYLSTERYA
jgi:hypothetical protein